MLKMRQLQRLLLLFVFLVRTVAEESANSILHRQQDDHGNYEFGFNIEGLAWDQFQQESGDALGRKTGAYGFRDTDGRLRLVEYVADELGFRVKVQTNEPGTKDTAMPSAVIDANTPASSVAPDAPASTSSSTPSESTREPIVSPPPARLLRRLSPLPPMLPRSLAAAMVSKVPSASERDAKFAKTSDHQVDAQEPQREQTSSSLRLPPSKSLSEKFETPLLPTGAVKMDAHPALRHYSPNIFQLGRPVYLGHAAPSPYYQNHPPPNQYHHSSAGPSAAGVPYAPPPQPRDNRAKGAALVPKEVNGRIVPQVALIRADGTLSTDEPYPAGGYPQRPQQAPRPHPNVYHRAALPLPGPQLFSSHQNTPNVGNIFPINTVHPGSLGFPAGQFPFYGPGGYYGQSGPSVLTPQQQQQQQLPPSVPGYQPLPQGLTVNYFLANSLPLTGRPVQAAPPVQPQPRPNQQSHLPQLQRPRVIDPAYLSQRVDPVSLHAAPLTPPQSQSVVPSLPDGPQVLYGQRLYPQARQSFDFQEAIPYRASRAAPGIQEEYVPSPALPLQDDYARRLPPSYASQQRQHEAVPAA
ncbi:uncharacterized protein LOC119441414 [Dermacentor silvarum]|uniref:uncharacterized protein LOC119441414 n=1 Tax=Dermacentor silvarum TaxID=543639 RepID=UPI00189834DA|nr:uncharacterized protein LOC119441414 [Dermacentor silvarum]